MKYWAFLSYSHTDRKWGDWLHKALETYRVPRRLVGKESREATACVITFDTSASCACAYGAINTTLAAPAAIAPFNARKLATFDPPERFLGERWQQYTTAQQHYLAAFVLKLTARVLVAVIFRYCFVRVPARNIPGSVTSHLSSVKLLVPTAFKCTTPAPNREGLIYNVAVPVQSELTVYLPVKVNWSTDPEVVTVNFPD